MTSKYYQAQFDFVARAANELTFRTGDIIQLLATNDSGMWKGELDGKVGLFPYNYVSECPSEYNPVCVCVFY